VLYVKTANIGKPKCLPQAQHWHIGCGATLWCVEQSSTLYARTKKLSSN
jgi:hypothetical protein